MKSRFTQFLMSLIIIAIIITFGLVGIIIIKEFTSSNNYNEDMEVGILQEDNTFLERKEENDYTTNDRVSLDTTNINSTQVITSGNYNQGILGNSEEITNYSSTNTNKYFYNQLNNYSKIMYNAFESNKEKMKTGTYQIELGGKLSDVLSKANGQEILGDYYQSAIEAYMYDNPDVFYLNPSNMYLNVETTTRGNSKTYNVYINNGEKESYLISEFSSKSQVDLALAKLESRKEYILNQCTRNVYQDIKKIHDYLVDNIEYDKTYSGENVYNIYGALIDNRCVCEGYAKAFKYLLDGLGIESTLVIGKATNSTGESENHAWNYVKINGNYYAVDTTWDDPIVIGGSATPEMRYKYFLKGEIDMNTDHFPSGKFTEEGMEFQYPPLSYYAYGN